MAAKKKQAEPENPGAVVTDEARAAQPTGADVAVDGHHPDSEIVALSGDELAHPSQIVSKEIRPDETGATDTAFATPDEEG